MDNIIYLHTSLVLDRRGGWNNTIYMPQSFLCIGTKKPSSLFPESLAKAIGPFSYKCVDVTKTAYNTDDICFMTYSKVPVLASQK